jgi:hypothetical protein
MGIFQQIIAEFLNQVPNAGLLLLFPIVALLMSLITTAGITMGAMFDAKAEAIERENYSCNWTSAQNVPTNSQRQQPKPAHAAV